MIWWPRPPSIKPRQDQDLFLYYPPNAAAGPTAAADRRAPPSFAHPGHPQTPNRGVGEFQSSAASSAVASEAARGSVPPWVWIDPAPACDRAASTSGVALADNTHHDARRSGGGSALNPAPKQTARAVCPMPRPMIRWRCALDTLKRPAGGRKFSARHARRGRRCDVVVSLTTPGSRRP